ncbi:hypothetical protein KY358_05945 [Candidatus Woesearchaeota archaeon]|nr:hypothetical protein [Candidatus Woesearchaeota archaeon]
MMNASEIRKKNDMDRMDFVKRWADYVRTHPDKVWSRQQNVLINSMIGDAKHSRLSLKEYLMLKKKR